MKNAGWFAAIVVVSLALTGCTSDKTGSSTGSPSPSSASPTPSSTSQAPTPTPRPPHTGQLPVPTTDPDSGADKTVNGFSARAVYALCLSALATAYPAIHGYHTFVSTMVRAADPNQSTDKVLVSVQFGALADGRPAGEMNCTIGGTPGAPVVTYTGPTDI